MTTTASINYLMGLPDDLVERIEEMATECGGRIIVIDQASALSLRQCNEPMYEAPIWYDADDVTEAIALLVPHARATTPVAISTFVAYFESADVIVATSDERRSGARILIEIPMPA
jgi:hypothetical protein